MHAKTLKVTVVISDFDQYLDVDTIGKKTFPVSIEVGGVKLTASLSSRSLRKAQATFKECGGEAAVIITGELQLPERIIQAAGIVVQVKVPKPAAVGDTADTEASDTATPEPIASPAPPEKPLLVVVKKKRSIEVPSS